MTYKPNPINTSMVEMPEEIQDVIEVLAKNIHETWAVQRIKEGWSYGPERNDERKEHPGLVPYDELTDQEKEYDRITVTETVKTLMALEYRIVAPKK
ncbi:RyR domain-containing protein [Evansella sp. AB-rgal1]|uniref:RyR domain-containing protein n=1 Tax=Evansella sp. AB-rgal1 TaxID=3242696 RepID=UPI00359DF3FF